MVRRVFVTAHGGPGVLRVREGPSDSLRPDGVRIRVAAAGVNFADLMMRQGLYPEAPRTPFVPGYEVAGRVVEAGAAATAGRPDLVPGASVLAVTRFGGYAEEVTVDAGRVFARPPSWGFVEAAAFPVVFLTAWLALRGMGRVGPGDRVLVPGIGGGVGLAALQIARAHGARVAGTCGGEAKAEAARALGAELVVVGYGAAADRPTRGWAPRGVDLALEPRGGGALAGTLELLAPAGCVVVYGLSGAVGARRNLLRVARNLLPALAVNPLRLIDRNAGVFGLNLLKLWDETALFGDAMADLLDGVAAGRYRPVVDRTFPLEEAPDAHRRLHDRANVGKVVLVTRHAAAEAGPEEKTT